MIGVVAPQHIDWSRSAESGHGGEEVLAEVVGMQDVRPETPDLLPEGKE
jgi:hypothetical protein